MNVSLNINGFCVNAHFDDSSVRELFLPLLHDLTEQQKQLGRRLTVLLAAPPGAGKSTLAAFLEKLSHETPSLAPVQALGMDGFHFHQSEILTRTVLQNGAEIPMQLIKGAPESFDVERLRHFLEAASDGEILWPYYDRTLHDVVEDAVPISAPILLVEGNWLLLDQPEWSLPGDVRIFIDAEESLLRDRLIERKMRGGSTHKEAIAHYMRTDGPNISLSRSCRRPSDFLFLMTGDGVYTKG